MKTSNLFLFTLSIIPLLLYFLCVPVFSFSTHPTSTTISRTFDKDQAFRSESIMVKTSFENKGDIGLRGFYYVDQVPEGLTINTISVIIDGNDISNIIEESGLVGEVYSGAIPYRWILETPNSFDENNPIDSNSRLEIVYSISSDLLGTFNFDEFNWVGYYQDANEAERASFGYNEEADKVTVTFLNNPPEAIDDSTQTLEDSPATINILTNDDDHDGTIDPNTVLILNGPANGDIILNDDGTVTYTPVSDFNGTDNFTYTMKDNDGVVSNEATVTITITPENDTPVANSQSISTDEDTPTDITLTGNDIDEDPLTFILMEQPAHGTLSGTAPNLTYSPNTNYNGPDSFTFMVNDGKMDSNIATVDIIVNPVNDVPEAENQSVTTDEDLALTITLTGSDDDGDPLTFMIVAGPNNGTLSGTPPNLIYSPNADYYGHDSFTFMVNDSTVDSDIGTVSITVRSVNDPPTAINDTAITLKNTPVTINMIENDTDPDGTINPGTIIIVISPGNGLINNNGNGTVTYTPNLDFTGTDVFTYTVEDNEGAISNEATVTVTVNEPIDRIDIDRKIKELKDGNASEEDVKKIIRQYMERIP